MKNESAAITGCIISAAPSRSPATPPGSGSDAEFFICIGPQPALDFGGTRNQDRCGFAAFGQVITGMDVVRRIWVLDASARSDDPYIASQILRAPVPIAARRV